MKRYNFFLYAFLTALFLGLTMSCDDDKPGDDSEPDQGVANFDLNTTLSSSSDYELEVYTQEAPFVGYNRMAFRVKSQDGTVLNDASLQLLPMMDMGATQHSTPVEQPSFSSEQNAFLGAITFVMPSTNTGNWQLSRIMQAGNMDEADTLVMDLTVEQSNPARLFSFVSPGGTPYFVAHREPTAPEVGMNPYGLMIYRRASMMNFPAATEMAVVLEPRMPSMGHGSPNNVQPTEMTPGYYEGEVNFTMTGLWRVYVDILSNQGDTLHSDSFDHTL